MTFSSDVIERLETRAADTRIICLGLSALDVVWRVETLFNGRGSEKIRAGHHHTFGGGMAATASVAIARLGAQAAFWGRGGADAAGDEMRRALAAERVDVGSFRLFSDGRSSVSGIIVDDVGEWQIVNFRGSFPEDSDWLPLDDVARASAVLADPRWPEGAAALFTAARKRDIPTVLDADVAEPHVFEALLPLTDHAIFSTPALAAYRPEASDKALQKIAGMGCRVAAVTRGEAGVLWIEDGVLQETPTPRIEAVDTTGAGDVFHGAYALAIGAGTTASDAMTFAAATAALKCTRTGGRTGIPSLTESLAFLKTSAMRTVV